jgi:hypothetical protein
MRKILMIVFLSLLLSGNAHSVRQDGSGELKISYQTLQDFKSYLRGETNTQGKSLNNKPLAFWVTTDGNGSYFGIVHMANVLVQILFKKKELVKITIMVRSVSDLQEKHLLGGKMESIQEKVRNLNLMQK